MLLRLHVPPFVFKTCRNVEKQDIMFNKLADFWIWIFEFRQITTTDTSVSLGEVCMWMTLSN